MLLNEHVFQSPHFAYQFEQEPDFDNMSVSPELLYSIPMFDDLKESEIAEIMNCFTEAEYQTGDRVFREGDAAGHACLVVKGELEVFKALPGGGRAKVGMIKPGEMVGEMALVSGGTRITTVRAGSPSTVINISRHFYRAALDQMSAPAFKILQAIMHVTAQRLGDLHSRILEQWDCEAFFSQSIAAGSEPATSEPSFNFTEFVRVLPCFEEFEDTEIDAIMRCGRIFEVPPGEYLFREGAPPETCFLILRGAVARSIIRDRRYQLSVLGPARLCGANALISGVPQLSDACVVSRALMLVLEKDAFENLFQMRCSASLKFQNMINADQLTQLKTANNLSSLLDSQNQIRNRAPGRSL